MVITASILLVFCVRLTCVRPPSDLRAMLRAVSLCMHTHLHLYVMLGYSYHYPSCLCFRNHIYMPGNFHTNSYQINYIQRLYQSASMSCLQSSARFNIYDWLSVRSTNVLNCFEYHACAAKLLNCFEYRTCSLLNCFELSMF